MEFVKDYLFTDACAALREPAYTFNEGYDGEIFQEIKRFGNFNYAQGVNKICIILKDCVLKKSYDGYCSYTNEAIETGRYEDDEVEFEDREDVKETMYIEALLYQLALDEEVSQFFAETQEIENDIFVQEKASFTLLEYVEMSEEEKLHYGYPIIEEDPEKYSEICKELGLTSLLNNSVSIVVAYLLQFIQKKSFSDFKNS